MLTLHKHLNGSPALATRLQHFEAHGLGAVEVDGNLTIASADPQALEDVARAFQRAADDLRAYQASVTGLNVSTATVALG